MKETVCARFHCLIGLMSNSINHFIPSFHLWLKMYKRPFEELGKHAAKKQRGVLCSSQLKYQKPIHRTVFQRISCFPGEVVLFQAVSELLCFSEKLQVVLSGPAFLCFTLSLNRRRNRGPDQLLGCVFLSRWLVLGQFMDLCRNERQETWVTPTIYTSRNDASGFHWVLVYILSAGVCGAWWSELPSPPSWRPTSLVLSADPASARALGLRLSDPPTPDAHWEEK